MARKIYKSTTGVEYMFHVPVGNKEVTIWTRESGNTFSTSDKEVQQAIEKHRLFVNRSIVLVGTNTEPEDTTGTEDSGTPGDKTTEVIKTTEPPVAPKDEDPVDESKAKGKEIANTTEAAKTEDADEQTNQTNQAQNEYPEVKYLSDAIEVLRSEPYSVPESELLLKKQVVAKAKELGVKFPNYR